jgi:hypothetical protein
MKATPRFMVRAALVLTAGGVIGAFGACKDTTKPEPPPPPPAAPAAPSGVTAVSPTPTTVNLTWTDNSTNETGFKVERCSGADCANFAQVGADLAANTTTFADAGLTASTPYSYRVAAFNTVGASTFATAKVTTASPPIPTSFTMVGAGEITTCQSNAGPTGTAAIVKGILDADTAAIAFTVGNNLADPTAGSTFESCFDPKWGSFKSRTRVALGNGDYDGGRGPSAVYGYFGDRAGPAGKGWYSFDKGSWHIVVLNTSTWERGSDATFGITPQLTRVPSEQVDWLTADLAANTKPCVAVISWERRVYRSSSNTVGRNSNMLPMGNIMFANGVDLLISAKDKLYARFAPMILETGTPDPAGVRQFIVGTGGRTLDAPIAGALPAGQEAEIRSWGVLKLTLGENNYSWEFLNSTPGGPTDKSDAPVACH